MHFVLGERGKPVCFDVCLFCSVRPELALRLCLGVLSLTAGGYGASLLARGIWVGRLYFWVWAGPSSLCRRANDGWTMSPFHLCARLDNQF